jgi:hypothetical protein
MPTSGILIEASEHDEGQRFWIRETAMAKQKRTSHQQSPRENHAAAELAKRIDHWAKVTVTIRMPITCVSSSLVAPVSESERCSQNHNVRISRIVFDWVQRTRSTILIEAADAAIYSVAPGRALGLTPRLVLRSAGEQIAILGDLFFRSPVQIPVAQPRRGREGQSCD